MVIGVLTIELQIPESNSLKEKRQVVRALIHRIRQGYNVSVAEVDHQNSWQLATVAVACVSDEAVVVQQLMDKIIDFVQRQRLSLVLLDYQSELL